MIFVPAYPTPIRNLLHNKPPIVVLNSHVIEGQTLNSRCTAGRHRSRPFVLDAKRTFFVAITPRLTSGQPGHPKTNRFVSFLRPSASISNVWHFLYLHFFKRSMNVSQMITEHFKSHFSRLGVAIHRSWCIGVIVAESGDRLAENSKLNICRVLSGDTPSFWCWILVVADGSCLRYISSRFLPVDIYESYFRVW